MPADKETTAATAETASVEASGPAATVVKEAEVGEKRKAEEEAPEGDAEKKYASSLPNGHDTDS